VTYNLAETSLVKSRPSVPYGLIFFYNGPYNGMNFAMKGQFSLNLLTFREV